MRTDWENPDVSRSSARLASVRPVVRMDAGPSGGGAASLRADGRHGAFSPSALAQYLLRNALIVLLLAALLFGGSLYAFRLVPFPFRSTAIVIVDPREQKISPTQDVLPGIGTNTAALESVVQIVQSGGFLAELLKRMDVSGDPELANARTLDPRSQLQEFRDRLTVERRGATYLVDISYTSKDPERAALYANRVAEAFVASESDARTGAASNAADSLSGRLGDLRQTLRLSEEAVARFKIASGVVDVDANSTLGQREIAELSEQLTLARSATDAARARAQNLASATAGGDAQSSELSFLRREQSDLARSLAELSQTYGARHPRIVDIRSKLSAIDTQIERERSLVGLSLKRQLDVAQAQQADLERRLAQLVGRAGRTDEAQVQLADLERQAASDRAIYEQYLTQYKAVDEQRLMPFEDVRVVSEAMPPLKSTRPSLVLVGAIAGIVSLGIAVLLVLVPGAIRGRFSRPRGMAS